MRMVLDVSRLLAVPTDFDELLCRIAEAATVLLGCERASIFLLRRAHRRAVDEGRAAEHRDPHSRATRASPGYCFTHAELVCVADPYHDPRFNPEPDRKSGFVTRNLLTAPMLDLDGRPLGVDPGGQQDRRARIDDGRPRRSIQLLAEQAGVAVQRHNLQAQALEIVAPAPRDGPRPRDAAGPAPAPPAQAPVGRRRRLELPRLRHRRRLLGHVAAARRPARHLPRRRLRPRHRPGPGRLAGAHARPRALLDIDPDPHDLLARVNAPARRRPRVGPVRHRVPRLPLPRRLARTGAAPATARRSSAPTRRRRSTCSTRPCSRSASSSDWDEDAARPRPPRARRLARRRQRRHLRSRSTPPAKPSASSASRTHLDALRGMPSADAVDALCAVVRDWQGAGRAAGRPDDRRRAADRLSRRR